MTNDLRERAGNACDETTVKTPFLFALFSLRWWGGVRFAAVLALGLGLWGGPPLRALRGQTTALPAAASTAVSAPAGAADLGQSGRQGPIDISSSGNTTFGQTPAGRIATAIGSVRIQTNDASIYCDRADYNVDTHEAELTGNVRIYRLDTSIVANHAIYNFDTKGIRALDFSGTRPPFAFRGVSGFSPGAGAQYNVRQGSFTTDDSSQPDYHLDAHRIRIYPDNRLVYVGATFSSAPRRFSISRISTSRSTSRAATRSRPAIRASTGRTCSRA